MPFGVRERKFPYNISGTVSNDTPAAVSGADVTLKQGGTVIACAKTDASGNYTIINISPGLYNLVTTKGSKTVTTLVTAKAEDENNVQQTAIKTAAGGQKPAQFWNITLKKGDDDIGDANETVLEIVQPFSFSGKTDVAVWRYHGAAAEKLKISETKPVAPFEDGTYFADSQTGLIYIYAARFSTYAISYQEVTSSSGGGTTSYSVTVKSSERGTVKADKTAAAPAAR